MECKETTSWLEAYIDGELEDSKRLEIESHLKNCAACRRLKENSLALHSAIASNALYFKTPAGLETRIHRALKEEQKKTATEVNVFSWLPKPSFWIPLTALALLLFVGRGNFLSLGPDESAQEAVSSHVRSLMASHLVDVQTSDQHVVKPWFNGKLDFSPPVVDFLDRGFPLAGGRLDYLSHRPVAALVYHRNLHPINLFIWPAENENEMAPKMISIQGYHAIHWRLHGMNYWLVSDLNSQELSKFADLVRQVN